MNAGRELQWDSVYVILLNMKNEKKLELGDRTMEKTKRNFLILCGSLVCIVAVTFLAGRLNIDVLGLRIAANVCFYLLNGLIAFVAMKLMEMEIAIDFKKKKQYIIGIVLAASLSLVIAVIPALCGLSLVGGHREFSWIGIIYDFCVCLLVIGPVEEFVFRVYLQDVFLSFFKEHEWLGVVFVALLFGLWHLINGNLLQVLFTFGIGLVFGFSKYKVKDCGYVGVAFGHGVYDFLNTVVRMFIV